MKNFFILFLAVISLVTSYCGSTTKKSVPGSVSGSMDTGSVKIFFREYEHHFGKVAEGEKIGYTFTFENKGTADLIISAVTTSCGCTVPKFDSRPISPGRTGNIEIVFNTSGRNGIQAKTITVKSNASTPVILLRITAYVVTNDK